MSDQQPKPEFGPLTLHSIGEEHASFHTFYVELILKSRFPCKFTNHKAKQDVYLSCFLSLKGKEGGQKAKAAGIIKEIPENLSYIKTN